MIASASRRARHATSRRVMNREYRISSSEREALLTQHVGLVHHVARQLAAHLSTAADLDELVSAGSMGLVQAVDSFDRTRGLSFSTYAVPRIRGAILDELRKQDHMPRNVRRRSREVTRVRDALVAKLQRRPTEQEVASRLHIPADDLRRWERDAQVVLCSLDQPVRSDNATTTLAETMADDSTTSLEDLLTHEYEVERLKAAIARLKEQERTVLALNFFEDLKLQEIGTILGLSVCRISQIRTAALAKLRVSLKALRVA